MKQFLKRFRIPLIVVGVLCLLSATALITHRAYAVKSAQDEGKIVKPLITSIFINLFRRRRADSRK